MKRKALLINSFLQCLQRSRAVTWAVFLLFRT